MIVLQALAALLVGQELAGCSVPLGLSALSAVPGHPYQGECFGEGSADFTTVAATLEQAVARGWSGKGATAYAEANQTLIDQANAMAALDIQMQNAVSGQAECVTKTQEGFAGPQDALIVALPMVVYLQADPATFWTAYRLACRVSQVAILTGVGLLSYCLAKSIQAMVTVQGIDYAAVAAAANQVSSDAQQSSDFYPTAPSGSDAVASAGTPAVSVAPPDAVAAGVGGTAPVSPGVSGAVAAAGPPAAPGVSPAEAGASRGDTPPQTAPTPGPLTPAAATAAGGAVLSGPAGRTGSTAPGTRASAPPQQQDQKPATPTGDSGNAPAEGAAPETPGAERAPIDAVAPDQAATPTPAPAQ